MRTKVKFLSVFCSVVFIAVCLAGCSDYLQNEPAENANDDSGYTEYTNQIYYVGKDIDAGQYLLCCAGTNSSMDVVLFSDEKDYQAFQEADPYTSGEFSTAFSRYGFVNFICSKTNKFIFLYRKAMWFMLATVLARLKNMICRMGKHSILVFIRWAKILRRLTLKFSVYQTACK